LTPLQKYTVVLHQLADGITADMIHKYLKFGKSTSLEHLEYYWADIIECYGTEFLRRITVTDTLRLLVKVEECGFSGILGSIDYMHWQCTTVW
jgi:hypothetical protein